MSNKPFLNYLAQKRDFECSYSQAVAHLAVAAEDQKAFWRAKLIDIDRAYTEFKKQPIPTHNL